MFVIQHPGGRPKEVAHCTGGMTINAARDRVKYRMDTEKGSSGSPVLNSILNVIALHHEAMPVYGPAPGGQQIKLKNGTWVSKVQAAKTPSSEIQYEANQGVSITAIVTDLITSANEFLVEHPEQYRYLYELLMQDPFMTGQIPQPPADPDAADDAANDAADAAATDIDIDTDANASTSSFGGAAHVKTEAAPMEQ